MKTIFLAVAILLANAAIGQTFENPKNLGKNEQLEFMVWYESGNDGTRMMVGNPNEINSFLKQLLASYDISETEVKVKGNSKTWRHITKNGTALEVTAIFGDLSGTILMKEVPIK